MRLVILSNRLKVTVTEENEKVIFNPSAGGLVSGLGAYLDSFNGKDYLWVGWPGGSSYTKHEEIRKELIDNYNSYPVFVEEEMMDKFYNGFCNETLWPLFHYFPSLTIFDEAKWDVYKKVNELFADEILKILMPGDILWIHDYHFMLLPAIVRAKRSDASIGFFLHIPFPSYEIFRLLPRKWGREILNGMLGSDLIGFHTYDYTQYFLRCVLRILGYNNNMGMIALENKFAKVETYPIGIDFNKFNSAVDLESVINEREQILREVQNMKIIFSVDRQDYTKGIQNRLKGYELFLRENPEWREKVVLIMVIVPSRIGVEEYQNAMDEINRIISSINGVYGNIHWTPVIFQYRYITFEQLTAYYNLSDVGLVTPLRDGMNLVAKEFVAAQRESNGVLILSEMAGASSELGEAIIINPNYNEEISEAIKEALEMPENERKSRISVMQDRLRKNDIKKWADSFVSNIKNVVDTQNRFGTKYLDNEALDKIIDKFYNSSKKIMFLDYDGTLVPFAKSPNEAVPTRKAISLLRNLSKIQGNEVIIISGRKKDELSNWFGNLNLTLVAEHGIWWKKQGDSWELFRHLETGWKPGIRSIMENFRDIVPNSFIEEKDYSLVWHFRNSDEALSAMRVKEFVDTIHRVNHPNGIETLVGNKIVEIKSSSINKGIMARHILDTGNYDFIMAAGDDTTDESLFGSLPSGSFTIKIGNGASNAGYFVNSSKDFIYVLEKLITTQKNIFRNILNLIKIKEY